MNLLLIFQVFHIGYWKWIFPVKFRLVCMKTRISVVNNALVIESLYPLPSYVIQSMLVFMEKYYQRICHYLIDATLSPVKKVSNSFQGASLMNLGYHLNGPPSPQPQWYRRSVNPNPIVFYRKINFSTSNFPEIDSVGKVWPL